MQKFNLFVLEEGKSEFYAAIFFFNLKSFSPIIAYKNVDLKCILIYGVSPIPESLSLEIVIYLKRENYILYSVLLKLTLILNDTKGLTKVP